MKYVSAEQLDLYFDKSTEKAMLFTNHPKSYTDKVQTIGIPKSLIKIAYNDANDWLLFIPSWYYMKELSQKLYNLDTLPKHGTLEQIKKTYPNVINCNDAEFD